MIIGHTYRFLFLGGICSQLLLNFLLGWLSFFLICRSPLYILETNRLLVICIASISSQIVAYLSILFMVFLVELKI